VTIILSKQCEIVAGHLTPYNNRIRACSAAANRAAAAICCCYNAPLRWLAAYFDRIYMVSHQSIPTEKLHYTTNYRVRETNSILWTSCMCNKYCRLRPNFTRFYLH